MYVQSCVYFHSIQKYKKHKIKKSQKHVYGATPEKNKQNTNLHSATAGFVPPGWYEQRDSPILPAPKSWSQDEYPSILDNSWRNPRRHQYRSLNYSPQCSGTGTALQRTNRSPVRCPEHMHHCLDSVRTPRGMSRLSQIKHQRRRKDRTRSRGLPPCSASWASRDSEILHNDENDDVIN